MGCVGTKIPPKPYDYPGPNDCMICFEQTRGYGRLSRIKPLCCGKVFCDSCWTQAVEVKKLTEPENALCPNCRRAHTLAAFKKLHREKQARRYSELSIINQPIWVGQPPIHELPNN